MNKYTELKNYYWELEFSQWQTLASGGEPFVRNAHNITTWLQVKFDIERDPARHIARILANWIGSGYVPAYKIMLERYVQMRDKRQPAYYAKIFGCKVNPPRN